MPPRNCILGELEPIGQGKNMSLITKLNWHVARTLCSACLGNKYIALLTRSTGYDHSSHSPLSHRTFSLCHFFGAVGLNLCKCMPIRAESSFLLILKCLSVCGFLKNKLKETKFISTITLFSLLCYINQVLLIRKDKNLIQNNLGQTGDLLEGYWILQLLLLSNASPQT